MPDGCPDRNHRRPRMQRRSEQSSPVSDGAVAANAAARASEFVGRDHGDRGGRADHWRDLWEVWRSTAARSYPKGRSRSSRRKQSQPVPKLSECRGEEAATIGAAQSTTATPLGASSIRVRRPCAGRTAIAMRTARKWLFDISPLSRARAGWKDTHHGGSRSGRHSLWRPRAPCPPSRW